jgi:hypothetical protein
MKIDLSNINKNDFIIREGKLSGEIVYLIFPKANPSWNKNNLILRSSVWDVNGNLISAGFPKFSNLGEKPEIFGNITDLDGASIVEKLDGSLGICSMWKGTPIFRTRGTLDARNLDNGQEVDQIIKMYPKLFSHNSSPTWNYSLLVEWLSPTNRIVIKHDVLDIKLVGGINHSDYSTMSQSQLDSIAEKINVGRPEYYKADSLEDLIKHVKSLKGKEGVCLMTKDGKIYKIKSDEYLIKHRMKEHLCSFDKLLDYYVQYKLISPKEMYGVIEKEIDWETAEETKEDVEKIYNEYKNIDKIIDDINDFVQSLKSLHPRESAEMINSKYGKSGLSFVAFALLKGRQISYDEKIKMLYKIFNNKKNSVLESFKIKTYKNIYNILKEI